MWPRRIVAIAVGLAAAVGMAGCAAPTTDDVAASALDEAGVEVGSSWGLVSGQVGGEDLRLLPDRPITFTRTADGVEGRSSCNTYAELGAMNERPDGRVFPDFEVTAMGCALPGEESLDNPIMDLEEAYLGALYDTTEVEVDGGELRMLGPDATLVFRRHGIRGTERPEPSDPAPDPSAASDPGTSETSASDGSDADDRDGGNPVATAGTWVLEAATVDGVALELSAGERVDLTASDGRMSGRTTCNNYGATYTVDGDHLDVYVTAVTDAGCPGARMDTQTTYLDALERVNTVERTGPRLTLSGDHVKLTYAEEAPIDPDPTVDPTTDPTRDGDDADTSSDALFAGTVFLWRTGGIAGLDESVTIRGDGLMDVTSEDVGSGHQLDRGRLASVAAALDVFDWDDLAARAETDVTVDDGITWHVQRFECVLDITDTQLPDPPPALLVEAAALMDEFAPNA